MLEFEHRPEEMCGMARKHKTLKIFVTALTYGEMHVAPLERFGHTAILYSNKTVNERLPNFLNSQLDTR